MRPLALLCLLAACPGPGRTTSPSAPGAAGGKRAAGDRQGRLVVLVVVDELPEWSFEDKRASLTGGIARLLVAGDWRSARLPVVVSSSAAGHALLGTGEPAAVNGIVAGEWWNRDQRRLVRADEIGGLRVPTLGDAAIAAHGKAVGVGIDAVSVRLVVGAHGRVAAIADPAKAATKPGSAGTPTGAAPGSPSPAAPAAPMSGGPAASSAAGASAPTAATPVAVPLVASDGAVIAAARDELHKDHLGRGQTTDLLVISLLDYARAAHAAGHDSKPAADALTALDEHLATLLDALDHDVGAGRWALVLTSDRGATKPPARGHYTIEQLRLAANNAASLELGGGDWIAWIEPPVLALTPAALARPKGDLKRAMRKVIYALHAFPELAIVDRADAFEGNCGARTGDDLALCLALDPARSGDFVFIPRPGWIVDSEAAPRASASGSLDESERLVPVLFHAFSRPPTAPAPLPMTAPTGEISASQITDALRTWLAE